MSCCNKLEKLVKLRTIKGQFVKPISLRCLSPPALSFSTGGSPHPHIPDGEKIVKSVRPGGKPWRDAASLIIATPNKENKNKTDFLVMKRSKGSTFAPNTLCFPGGVISPADEDPKWIDHFRETTYSFLNEIEFIRPNVPSPQIYSKMPTTELKTAQDLVELHKNKVPPHVALRIAAVRETFEETGILIVRKNVVEEVNKLIGREGFLGLAYPAGTHVFKDPDEVESWQQRVKEDPFQFFVLCRENLLRPDLNAMAEWSEWLTPNSFGVRRFDTIFYMVVLKEAVPFLCDPFEVASVRWTTADKVLQGAKDGKAKLIPPQIYELDRLKDSSVERITQLMKIRLNLGVERWCPCYIKAKDGITSIFPGDDLYPEEYKIEEFEEIRTSDKTLEELKSSTKNHHRIHFKSEYEFELLINISPRLGQVYPKY